MCFKCWQFSGAERQRGDNLSETFTAIDQKIVFFWTYIIVAIAIIVSATTIAIKYCDDAISRGDVIAPGAFLALLWPMIVIVLPFVAIYWISVWLAYVCTKRNYCRLLIFWRDL